MSRVSPIGVSPEHKYQWSLVVDGGPKDKHAKAAETHFGLTITHHPEFINRKMMSLWVSKLNTPESRKKTHFITSVLFQQREGEWSHVQP